MTNNTPLKTLVVTGRNQAKTAGLIQELSDQRDDLVNALEGFVKYVEDEIDLDMINIEPELVQAKEVLKKVRGGNV